jgi:uncharacterized delta-60 repeat protein
MATASLRIASSDPASPKVVTLRSQIGNAQQTAECDVDSLTATVVVADNEVHADTLAEANAAALEQAETERGPCQWTNDQQDCPEGYTGDSIAAGTVISEVSKADANAQANAMLACVEDVSPDWIGVELDASVRAITVSDDYDIFICGDFTTADGSAQAYVAKLNPDGTPNSGFGNPGVTSDFGARSLAIESDGSVLVGGGDFPSATRDGMIRVTTAGVFDPSLPDLGLAGTGVELITTVIVESDTTITLFGAFETILASTRNRGARISASGTLDSGFNPNFNNTAYDGLREDDGKYLVVGSFTQAGGVGRDALARINADGTLDSLTTPALGGTALISGVAKQSDGRIIIGGYFQSVGGHPTNRIARLNTDGTVDTSFNPGVIAPEDPPNPSEGYITAIAVDDTDRILIGGWFTSVDGQARANFARLNPDGTVDTSFPDIGLPGSASDSVECIAVQADGKILIGGLFTSVLGEPRWRIARLLDDGTLDT